MTSLRFGHQSGRFSLNGWSLKLPFLGLLGLLDLEFFIELGHQLFPLSDFFIPQTEELVPQSVLLVLENLFIRLRYLTLLLGLGGHLDLPIILVTGSLLRVRLDRRLF